MANGTKLNGGATLTVALIIAGVISIFVGRNALRTDAAMESSSGNTTKIAVVETDIRYIRESQARVETMLKDLSEEVK